MKNLLQLIGLCSTLCIYLPLYSQIPAQGYLNANQILTTMSSNGVLFLNEDYNGTFIAPYVAEANRASTLFAGNLWLGAKDADGRIFISASTYGQDEGSFQAGPINASTGEPFGGMDSIFNRVWSISRTEILALKEDFSDGVIDDPIAKDILEWPAKGNTYFQDAFEDQQGAAFFDNDSDGRYNPYAGDFPIIGEDMSQVIPDQLLYAIFNDLNPLADFANNAIHCEVHLCMYAMQCEDLDAISNSVFTRFNIINRSNRDYQNFHIGVFFDGDLGCYTDDHAGCDTTNNLVYYYNRDPIDGDENGDCPQGIDVFNEDIPVQSFKLLNSKLHSFVTQNSPAFADELPLPPLAEQYFNGLQGKWRDGTPVTVGGNGFNTNSQEVTKYLFPGNPNNEGEWSMYDAGLSAGDRRVIASQEFGNMLSGEELSFDGVFTFNRKEGFDHLRNVDFAISQALQVQTAYDLGFVDFCHQSNLCNQEHCVYPGDVNDDEIVDRLDFMLQGIAYANTQEAFEVPRTFISQKWDEFPANARTKTSLSGVNFVHADCNGDGVIDLREDWDAMRTNFGFTSRKYIPSTLLTEVFPFTGEVIVELPDEYDIESSGLLSGEVAIENMINFHSISYVLEYDPEIFEPIGDYALLAASGVNDPSLGFIYRQGSGEEMIIKGNNVIGISNVERISDNILMRTKPNIPVGETTIRVSNILIADFAENFYTLGGVEHTIELTNPSVSTKDFQLNELTLYPNPTQGTLSVSSEFDIDNYRVYSTNGQICQEGELRSGKIHLNQAAGLYFIQFYNASGLVARKKIALH